MLSWKFCKNENPETQMDPQDSKFISEVSRDFRIPTFIYLRKLNFKCTMTTQKKRFVVQLMSFL